MILVAIQLGGCKPPPEPGKPATQPASEPLRPLIIIVPGLGNPGSATMADMLRTEFPAATVIDFGTGVHSYRADVAAFIADIPRSKLIVLDFSYGADKVNQQIASFGPVELDIKLDPVPEELGGRFTITSNVKKTIVLTGDWSGLFRAGIDGPYDEFKVPTTHKKFLSHPSVLKLVRLFVAESLKEPNGN
jgi:hypothetical protein